MKKIFTSLLMLLVSASSFATDEITSGTNYYIQNKESGLFLCGANCWGTQASVANEGELFTLTGSNGKFTIYDTALSSSNKYLGSGLYTDTQTGETFTFTAVTENGGGILQSLLPLVHIWLNQPLKVFIQATQQNSFLK